MIVRFELIAHDSNLWSRPIRNPAIKVAVVIPVAKRDRTTIVVEIQSAGSRGIGKQPVASIQINTIAFMAAEGMTQSHQTVELTAGFGIWMIIRNGDFFGG